MSKNNKKILKQNHSFELRILGDNSEAKLSLLNNFHYRKSDELGRNLSLELDVDNKKLNLSTYNLDKGPYVDSMMALLHNEKHGACLLSYCSGLVIAYDISNLESFNSLAEWIHQANRIGSSESEKIIVGIRSNETDRREITFEQGREFANKHDLPFMEVSSKEEINKLFTTLASKMMNARYKKNLVREGEKLAFDGEINGELLERVFNGLPLYEKEQRVVEFLDLLDEKQFRQVMNSVRNDIEEKAYYADASLKKLALKKMIDNDPADLRNIIKEHPDNRLESSIKLVCKSDLMEKIFRGVPLYEEEKHIVDFFDGLSEECLTNLQERFSAKVQDTSSLINLAQKNIIDHENFVYLFKKAITEHPDNSFLSAVKLVCESDLMEKVFSGLPLHKEEKHTIQFCNGLDEEQLTDIEEEFFARIKDNSLSLSDIAKKSIIDLVCESNLIKKILMDPDICKEEKHIVDFFDGLDEETRNYLKEKIDAKIGLDDLDEYNDSSFEESGKNTLSLFRNTITKYLNSRELFIDVESKEDINILDRPTPSVRMSLREPLTDVENRKESSEKSSGRF